MRGIELSRHTSQICTIKIIVKNYDLYLTSHKNYEKIQDRL
jgi:hypothetical protein